MREFRWVNERTRKEVAGFPREAQQEIALAIRIAQRGEKAVNAKPLKGFPGTSVMQISVDDDGDTYRAVYTAQFGDVIWILHAFHFQKKSTHGIATSQRDIELIRERFKQAKAMSTR